MLLSGLVIFLIRKLITANLEEVDSYNNRTPKRTGKAISIPIQPLISL